MELILLTRCANMALATNLDSSELLNAGLTGGLVDCEGRGSRWARRMTGGQEGTGYWDQVTYIAEA